MMPASIQKAVARNGYRYDILFEQVIKDLQADIAFANLETPVDDRLPISGYPKFNSRPELLAALKRAGIGVVSVANNHALDAGPGGLIRTLDNIEAAGIVSTGAGRTRAEAERTSRLTAKGISAAFLAYTYATNEGMPRKKKGMPSVKILRTDSDEDLARAAADVRQARASADLVCFVSSTSRADGR
jgi:poly-gamma-glutamate synthesis protein (capsule biosynthesis protein)